jgi:hypothetical protein
MKKIVKGIMVIVGCSTILFANQATAQSLKKSKMENSVLCEEGYDTL